MDDSVITLLIMIGTGVFIVGFGIAMFFIVRSDGMERPQYGKLSRNRDGTGHTTGGENSSGM